MRFGSADATCTPVRLRARCRDLYVRLRGRRVCGMRNSVTGAFWRLLPRPTYHYPPTCFTISLIGLSCAGPLLVFYAYAVAFLLCCLPFFLPATAGRFWFRIVTSAIFSLFIVWMDGSCAAPLHHTAAFTPRQRHISCRALPPSFVVILVLRARFARGVDATLPHCSPYKRTYGSRAWWHHNVLGLLTLLPCSAPPLF